MKSVLQRNTLSLGGWIAAAILLALIVVAILAVANFLASFPIDSGSDDSADVALAFGAIMTLAVGGGLMTLVFYSSRRGFDEASQIKPVERDDK